MAYHFHYDKNIHPMFDLVWFTDTITLSPSETKNSDIIDLQGCNHLRFNYYTLMAHSSSEVLVQLVYIWNMEEKYTEAIGTIGSGTNVGGTFAPVVLVYDTILVRFTENSARAAAFEVFIKGWR